MFWIPISSIHMIRCHANYTGLAIKHMVNKWIWLSSAALHKGIYSPPISIFAFNSSLRWEHVISILYNVSFNRSCIFSIHSLFHKAIIYWFHLYHWLRPYADFTESKQFPLTQIHLSCLAFLVSRVHLIIFLIWGWKINFLKFRNKKKKLNAEL